MSLEINQFRALSSEELSQFFYNLFLSEVSVRSGGYLVLRELPAFVVSVYKNSKDAIIGALLLDISAAAALAGALCDLPEDGIQDIIDNNSFPDSVWGDLREVLNITSQLFTGYDGDSITLEEIYLHPKNLPEEALEVLEADYNPLLFRIQISGYGHGVMAVLDAQNNPVFAELSQDTEHSIHRSAPPPVTVATKQAKKAMEPSYEIPEADLFGEEEEETVDIPQTSIPKRLPTPTRVTSSFQPLYTILFVGLGGLLGAGFMYMNASSTEEQTIESVETNTVSSPTTNITQPKLQLPQKQKFQHAYEIEQVLVPKGAFYMGCSMEYSAECSSDEFPAHIVSINYDFYMMKTEVTQELYQSITKQNSSRFTTCGFNCPIENISWYQAVTFANQLSKFQSLEECYTIDKNSVIWEKGTDCLGYRLPTEAEWEYAARGSGGKSTGNKKAKLDANTRNNKNVWVYAGGNDLQPIAWYGGYSSFTKDTLDRTVGVGEGTTHAVCEKAPNDLGLCDMTGNVWEWTWDWYGPYSRQKSKKGTEQPQINPSGVTQGSSKVLRGGSWLSKPKELRTSYRLYATPNIIDSMVPSYGSFGIRLVRTSPKIKTAE